MGRVLGFTKRPSGLNYSLKTHPPPYCETLVKLVQDFKAFKGNFRQAVTFYGSDNPIEGFKARKFAAFTSLWWLKWHPAQPAPGLTMGAVVHVIVLAFV